MKNICGFSLVTLLLTLSIASAAPSETYFTFHIKSAGEIHTLTRIISIDNVSGLTVYAYANPDELAALKRLGYTITVLPNPSTLIVPKMAANKEALAAWDSYPTYAGYVAMMNQFAASFPTICAISNIGATPNGHSLLAAKLTTNVGVHGDKPAVFFTSSIHGDEVVGYVLMLRLVDYLLNNYGSDPLVTRLLDSCEIWINPLANPDGTYRTSNNSVTGATRYNANNIDLNRNFPDPKVGPHPDGHSWQTETVAMMNFAAAHTFVLSANFHGGAQVVNYPWDTWPRTHVDNDWYVALSRAYADTVHSYAISGYMTDLNNGITDGYAWYEVNGGRQDYMTYWRGDREVTIELSATKLPSGSQLPNYWNYNWRSFLHYLESSLYGIRGVVTDSVTGGPLAAMITIPGHDTDLDSSRIFSDPIAGDYHRMISSGTYDIHFAAAGYYPVTISDITVGDHTSSRVNIALVPLTAHPLITTIAMSDWTIGVPLSFQLQAYGGNGALGWNDKNADLAGTGLALSGSGLLSGNPVVTGMIHFTAQVTDIAGHSDQRLFSFTINPALTITTIALPDGTAGNAYATPLSLSGGTEPIIWSDSGGSLTGSGLTISAGGLLSGMVPTPSTVSFTAQATDDVGAVAYARLSVTFQRGYICGDANGDTHVNVGDAVFLINYIFKLAAVPNPLAAGDANCDGHVNVGDAVSLINFVFKSGAAPCCP
jgi:hypothetical protein